MSSLRALPRAALGVEFVGAAVKLLRASLPVLVGLLLRGDPDWFGVVGLASLPLVLLYTVVHHRRFRYGLEGDRFVIESGVLWHTRRTLPLDRIHAVSVRSTPIHALCGVVEVTIEAAGAQGAEVRIPGVLPDEVARLQRLAAPGGDAAPAAEAASGPGTDFWSGQTSRILLHGATDTRLLLALAALGGLWASGGDELLGPLISDHLDWPAVELREESLRRDALALLGRAAILVAIALPVLAAVGWVTSILYSLAVYGGFVARREDGALSIRHGLLVRRQHRITPPRLQMIVVAEPPLRRWLGYGSIEAETAADAAAAAAGGRLLIAPIVERADLDRTAAAVHPAADLRGVTWRRVHPSTLRLRLRRPAVALALGGLAAAALSWPALAALAAIIALVDAGAAAARTRAIRWAVDERRLVVRSGALWRRTAIVPLDCVQFVQLAQGPPARRRGVAAIAVDTAGSTRSRVVLRYLSTADALALAGALRAPADPPAAGFV